MRSRFRPLARIAVLCTAFVAAAGCGRCRPGALDGPERFVPADAPAVVIVPELRRLARETAEVHRSAAAFPGLAQLGPWRAAIAAQLGLDPLDPERLEEAGFDPDRGAAIAWLLPGPGAADPAGTRLLVLPVADAGKVEALLARLARDRLGAGARVEEVDAGRHVVTWRAAPGAPAALAAAFEGGAALVVAGPGGAQAVIGAAARAHAASLAASAPWDRARRALGEDATAILWVPPGSLAVPHGWPLGRGFAAGLAGGATRLKATFVALLGEAEPKVRALVTDSRGGAELAARADPRAAIVARFDGDPAVLGQLALPWLPARERARFAALGLDLQRDLFDQVLPGAAGAIRVNPELRIPGLSEAAFRADPLRAIRFEAVVRVRDPAKAREISARVARNPGPPWRIPTRAGEFAWRLDGDRLAIVGGAPGDLERFVARLDGEGGYEPPTRAARAALEDGLAGAVLDPANLLAQARALPQSAFGTGPSGFVLRSLIGRVLEPAGRLTAVSARAELVEGALRVTLEAEARAPNGEARP